MLHDSVLSFCIFRFSVRVTGPTAGKCSKHPTEIAREQEIAREKEIESKRPVHEVIEEFHGWR